MVPMVSIQFPGSSTVYEVTDATARAMLLSLQTALSAAEEKMGDLDDLDTTAKTSLVAAINELAGEDGLPSGATIGHVLRFGQNGAAWTGDLTTLEAAVAGLGNPITSIAVENGVITITYADDDEDTVDLDIPTPQIIGSMEVDENNYFHIYDGEGNDLADPVLLPAGGGESSSGTASISYVTDASVDCVYGETMPIEFRFAAADASGDTVGSGVGTWTVGGIVVASGVTVAQGLNTFDITRYLSPGVNNVRLTVSVDVGGEADLVRSKPWTINAVAMSFEWDYDDDQVNTGAFTDRWTVYGAVEKTTHTSVDGVELDTIVSSRSSVTQTLEIPMQTHGAHSVERWLTATIGGVSRSTAHQKHDMIFAVTGNDTPIVAISMLDATINQYDTVRIPFVVYDPESLTAEVTIDINGTEIATDTVDRSAHTLNYTPTTSGTHVLTITCGSVSRSVTLTVEAVDLDVSEVGGYSFRFKASDLATNNAARNWSSNGVTASFSSNFDWINGGLHTELDENGNLQQYFCIKAGTRMTVNHKLFAVDPRGAGMNFKMIFKVENCRDYDAQILECYAENSGIRGYAHRALFNSTGTALTVPYGEDEYIELEFDVYPAPTQAGDGKYRYMMAWIDGVITSCRVYGASDSFIHTTANQQNITIGSDDCDVYLYMIKAYPALVSRSDHIDNFIVDAPNSAEMISRYNRNNILGANGEIDYEKLITANPDCRVWLYDIPYMTNGKKDYVENCSFRQFWYNGTKYYEIVGVGIMSVQGTSSVRYIQGAANTDINFTELTDGDGNDLLEGGTLDESYGKSNNWYVEDELNPGHAKVFVVQEGDELGPECVPVERNSSGAVTKYIKALGIKINDDSCPISYSNTKVNFASCEQVNNMCNAIWYQRFNPYPSLTPRDCMEFAMGVQFIKDSGQIPDASHFVLFGDDKYHMYSIANMGTSKKNVHVFHDLTNPNECCIEICDNNTDQQRMVSDDLSGEDWSGDIHFGMRFPDTKNPSTAIRNAWQRLLTWMASRNPSAYTGAALSTPETYEPYTFAGHSRPGSQVLRGTTVTQYAGTYTHDTFNRRMARMLSECEDYLVMDSIVYQFCFIERHTNVDNVAKNTFWSSSDLLHWDMSKAYDMDTSDGNNNQGQLVFDYGYEYNDTLDSRNVFNAADSVWFVFVANLYEACRTMFVNREAAGAWSATAYHAFLLSEQRKVPERCWVECFWYDYLRTYEQGINGEWMSFLDGGQKTHQRKHFETYEEQYDSSKYRGTVSTSQTINFRAYTPSTWGAMITNPEGAKLYSSASTSSNIVTTIAEDEVITITGKVADLPAWRSATYGSYSGYIQTDDFDAIEPKYEMTVTMYNKMYISVDAGTTQLPPVKAEKGVPYVINFEDLGYLNNILMAVNSAPMIRAISGLAQLYPDTFDAAQASRLRVLAIGSDAVGYSNPNLQTLAVGTNRMLEELYAQNLPNALSPLDLTQCPALLYLDTRGSGFTSIDFAPGGVLEEAHLEAPTAISLRDLAYLTDAGFTIEDFTNLTSLRHENTPGVDSLALVQAATALTVVRLIAIDWQLASTTLLDALLLIGGMDESGISTAVSVLTGEAYAPVMTQRRLGLYAEAWPGLDVSYTSLTEQYAVTFVNADGSPILDRQGNNYVQYVDRGSTAYDPVQAGEVDTPTRAADDQYTYVFSGWSGISGAVMEARTVTADYTATVRTYTVRWLAQVGDVRKSLTDVPYGSNVAYDDDPYAFPELNDEDESYIAKAFLGWNKSTGYITGDTDVYAVWDRAALPTPGSVDLDTCTPGQLLAIIKFGKPSDYFTAGDWLEITLGRNPTYSNVEEETIISTPTYFDGTSVQRTDIKLFDADAPTFTLAIDYEFTATTAGATLVSAFEDTGSEGFRLRYNSAPDIQWGDQHINVGYGMTRGIVVIRHRKGSNNLYIASSNNGNMTYNTLQLASEVARSRATETDAVLAFGGVPLNASVFDYGAAGWIHWCKVWYGDLGNTVLKQIGQWPHEPMRYHYTGPQSSTVEGRYRLAGDSGERCSMSFISNAEMALYMQMATSNTNVGGWKSTNRMRPLLEGRVFDAFPIWLQAMIKTVQTITNVGNGSSASPSLEVETSNDRLYLISYGEAAATTTEPYVSEGVVIPFFVDNKSRVKFAGLIVPEDSQYITGTTDPTLLTETYTLKKGDVWYNNSNYHYYIPANEAANHGVLAGRLRTDSALVAAADNSGAVWARSNTWWLRSPWSTASTYFAFVHNGGGVYYSTASYTSGAVPSFSI